MKRLLPLLLLGCTIESAHKVETSPTPPAASQEPVQPHAMTLIIQRGSGSTVSTMSGSDMRMPRSLEQKLVERYAAETVRERRTNSPVTLPKGIPAILAKIKAVDLVNRTGAR